MPKLSWLKKHLPESFGRAARFLDLPDFLVYRATGEDVRSLCTTVCKWTYLGQDGGRWSDDFFAQSGSPSWRTSEHARIGSRVRPMGERAGGLTRSGSQGAGALAGHSRGRQHHRRPCRRPRLARHPPGRQNAERGRAGASPRAHRRHLQLPHGGEQRAALRARRVGAVLFRHGARDVAHRRRPIRHRRAHRSRDLLPRARRRAEAARRRRGHQRVRSAERRSRPAGSTLPGSAHARSFTCSRTSTATAHPARIPH